MIQTPSVDLASPNAERVARPGGAHRSRTDQLGLRVDKDRNHKAHRPVNDMTQGGEPSSISPRLIVRTAPPPPGGSSCGVLIHSLELLVELLGLRGEVDPNR